MEKIEEMNIEKLNHDSNLIIINNKYLVNQLDLYKKYINLTKEIIQKCLNNKNSSLELFNSYINEIQKDYDNLFDEYNKNDYSKFKNLKDECLSDISLGKPVLYQNKGEEFVLDYLKDEKDDLINGLQKSIKQTKEYQLFREPKRDSLIDIKNGNKKIEKVTTELQQNMLYECKKCNKFSNLIKKYNYQIKELKKNIAILKKYVNPENKKGNKREKKFIAYTVNPFQNQGKKKQKNKNTKEIDSLNEMAENYSIKKKKNTIISEFKTVEELFELSSEEGEELIDEELHSDDESVFENKIKQSKKLSSFYLKEIKKSIPDINLKQIEFNKLKIMNEEDLYSIQRRKYKSQNLNGDIKEFNKSIQKIKEKNEIIKKKEQAMKEYITKLKEKYNILKRPQTLSFYNKDSDFIKKSLFNGDYIKEELSDNENDSASNENEYENRKSENNRENKFPLVGISLEKKKNNFKDFFFKNYAKLKENIKKKKKSNSK